MVMMAADDSGFMIRFLFSYELFGHTFWITTTHVALLIVDIVIIIFALKARSKIKNADPEAAPGGFLNIVELLVEALQGIVKGSMGENAKRFQNYVCTIFLFIFLSNISGLFGLRAPTADYGVTLILGVYTFILVHFNGIRKNGLGHFAGFFKPLLLTPINIIGELAVPISLSLRLFGNVMSGTVMLGLWYGGMPIFTKLGIPSALHAYFDLFSGAIQTYVFGMLTMVYINEKIADE